MAYLKKQMEVILKQYWLL